MRGVITGALQSCTKQFLVADSRALSPPPQTKGVVLQGDNDDTVDCTATERRCVVNAMSTVLKGSSDPAEQIKDPLNSN